MLLPPDSVSYFSRLSIKHAFYVNARPGLPGLKITPPGLKIAVVLYHFTLEYSLGKVGTRATVKVPFFFEAPNLLLLLSL